MPAYHSEFNSVKSLSEKCASTSGIYLIPISPSKSFSPADNASFIGVGANDRLALLKSLHVCGDVSSVELPSGSSIFSHNNSASLDPLRHDIIDECLALFRVNCFFKDFEFTSPNDPLLVYLTLFVSELLRVLKPNTTPEEALKTWNTVSFSDDTDSFFPAPDQPTQDTEMLRTYLAKLRQETAKRLHQKVYPGTTCPSKWWMAFQKRKFINKTLLNPH